MTPDVTRAQVLAYRAQATGLHRTAPDARALDVLALGVQDTPAGSARQAVAVRLGRPLAPEDDVVLAWSLRGAPHLHRGDDLPRLAAALWPMSDADATSRITSVQIPEGSRLGVAAFTAAATALHAVVAGADGPLPKGEASGAVSARVPPVLTYDCPSCRARHVSGGLFQQVGLAAATRLEPRGRSVALAAREPWPLPVPPGSDVAATADLLRAYLRLLGPATRREAAAFLGTTPAAASAAWPDGLAEVRVGGRAAWLPADRVEVLLASPPPPGVRLLPPGDPFLQARDRDLLVPDRARRMALWTALSAPGAVLVRGEVAGTWRAAARGRRLEVTVSPYDGLDLAARAGLEAEAALLAAARGLADSRVVAD